MSDILGPPAGFVLGCEDCHRSVHRSARFLHSRDHSSTVVFGFQGSAGHVPLGYQYEEGREGGMKGESRNRSIDVEKYLDAPTNLTPKSNFNWYYKDPPPIRIFRNFLTPAVHFHILNIYARYQRGMLLSTNCNHWHIASDCSKQGKSLSFKGSSLGHFKLHSSLYPNSNNTRDQPAFQGGDGSDGGFSHGSFCANVSSALLR